MSPSLWLTSLRQRVEDGEAIPASEVVELLEEIARLERAVDDLHKERREAVREVEWDLREAEKDVEALEAELEELRRTCSAPAVTQPAGGGR